jgi:hypothetical protein
VPLHQASGIVIGQLHRLRTITNTISVNILERELEC